MTAPFDFATANRIRFGAGRIAALPDLVETRGARAIVLTGSRPERFDATLAQLPVAARLTVTGEPTVETAAEALALALDARADVVIAIGGGSVLDLGKALAMLMGNGGEPLDYLEVVGRGQPISKPSLPMIAVPTTAGSGSEVTANAVLASTQHHRKASLRSPSMLPQVALVDPELTLSCPPAVTASSGLDALTQALEPFVSAQANPVTDAMATEAMARAARSLLSAYTNGADLAARTDMALCSLLGGMCLANAKLGAVHGFAGVIGGRTGAPHGAVCAALLPAVIEVNVRALTERAPQHPALVKYTRAARILTGRDAATAADGVGWVREIAAALGVPALTGLGVPVDEHAEIAAEAKDASSMRGNPIELTTDELLEVLDRSAA